MGKFFEFLEKIRTEKMLFEQDMAQMQPQQQPAENIPQNNATNQTAPDATPEQQDAGATEDSGLSPTAHDDNFSKLIDSMKEALPNLKPENKKIIDEILKSNNLSGGDEPKKEEPQIQSGADANQGNQQPSQVPPDGMGNQSGMPAPMNPQQK